MTTALERKQEHRYRLLKAIYEETDGHTGAIVLPEEIGKRIGLDPTEVDAAETWLENEGLLKGVTLGGEVRITHQGVREIEKSKEMPTERTEHFPHTVFNFHGSVGAVQNGPNATAHVTQNVTTNHDVKTLIQQLRAEVSKMPPEEQGEAIEIVDDIDREVGSPTPKKGKLRSMIAGAEKVIGNPAIVAILTEIAKKVLGT